MTTKGIVYERNLTCSFCGRNGLANLKLHLKRCEHPGNASFDKDYHTARRGYPPGEPGRKWTKAQMRKHSKVMLKAVENHPDSYKGRWRKYSIEYEGNVYDSAWEVAMRKYFDQHHITATRTIKSRIEYNFAGAIRTYTPDFYLPKLKIYVEVKGVITERDIAKWAQFPKGKRLLVLTRKTVKRVQGGLKVGLTKKIRAATSQILVDGYPLDTSALEITSLREQVRVNKLTPEERSIAIKRGQARSPAFQKIRKEAALRKKQKEKLKHKSYSGPRGSQYGTFWITDGTANKKWHDDLGKLPRNFHPGRTVK